MILAMAVVAALVAGVGGGAQAATPSKVVETSTKSEATTVINGQNYYPLHSYADPRSLRGQTEAPREVLNAWAAAADTVSAKFLYGWGLERNVTVPEDFLSADNGKTQVIVLWHVRSSMNYDGYPDPGLSTIMFWFQTKGDGVTPPSTGTFLYARATLLQPETRPGQPKGIWTRTISYPATPYADQDSAFTPDDDGSDGPWYKSCTAFATFVNALIGKKTSSWISRIDKEDPLYATKYGLFALVQGGVTVGLGAICLALSTYL